MTIFRQFLYKTIKFVRADIKSWEKSFFRKSVLDINWTLFNSVPTNYAIFQEIAATQELKQISLFIKNYNLLQVKLVF